ncbi:hypothetical protein [Streptomyces sp. NBC_00316]|uniref:hypothetical protein n=1 Tax=Streptomyces sp. NBC_00316 TaxID=2975710 RepID=UPI002E2CE9A1|nr:hypothetical protein [Streptomyces sp. NBC_00316]
MKTWMKIRSPISPGRKACPAKKLDAEIALLEAHEARIAKDCTDLAWQKLMFRACTSPTRDGLTPSPFLS